jgi:hypothetical protein
MPASSSRPTPVGSAKVGSVKHLRRKNGGPLAGYPGIWLSNIAQRRLGAIRRRNGWRSFLAGCCRNRWLARHHAGDTPATTEDGGPDSSDLLRVAERPPRLGRLGSAKKSLSGVQMSGKALASGFSADPEPVASAIPLGYLPVASAIPLSYFFADPYFAVACRLAKVASTVASCCSSCCRLSRSRWTTSAGARSTKPALASLFCLPWI